MTDLDVLARAAVERARQEAVSIDVPRVNDVTTPRAGRHRRQRVGVALAVAAVVAGAVFSVAAFRPRDSARLAIVATPTTTSAVPQPGATLEFRAVSSAQPFRGCKPTADRPTSNAVLPDRKRSACYLLGPVLLDGTNVASAVPVASPTASGWELDVHFRNDEFVTKVAIPYVNRQVAIVVDGVVQSAPTINPGITGRDVTISGDLTRAEAENLARRLAP